VAYDEGLAERVREVLGERPGVTARKMFGGIAFMLDGNMAVGVLRGDLVVRVASADADGLLADAHIRPMDVTGRPMRGWLLVGPEATAEDHDLERWVARGTEYASSLPAK
jgi:TfoX N-terminal domain